MAPCNVPKFILFKLSALGNSNAFINVNLLNELTAHESAHLCVRLTSIAAASTESNPVNSYANTQRNVWDVWVSVVSNLNKINLPSPKVSLDRNFQPNDLRSMPISIRIYVWNNIFNLVCNFSHAIDSIQIRVISAIQIENMVKNI